MFIFRPYRLMYCTTLVVATAIIFGWWPALMVFAATFDVVVKHG